MAGFTTSAPDYLIRSEVWSNELKRVLQDELMGQKYIRMLEGFPDGDTFTIPSIGELEVQDYVEDTNIQYTSADTGEFQFSITEYLSSATYITNKNKQDSMYMDMIQSEFVPMQLRAIMQRFENDVMDLSSSQTADDTNTINGAYHRFVGAGTNETMTNSDFAKAKFALKKANVPLTNLVAIVDPSVAYAIETQTGISDVTYNPMWQGIVESGISDGMRFVRNIYGFDVYESNYLADANETIDGTTTASGKANMFFSAAPGVIPFVGAWRQMPKVDSEYNKDKQREEYVTTARYGLKLYRPENLVCVLTDTDQVY